MEALAKFLEFMRVPIKYIIGAFVISAIFIFSPASLLSSLGVPKYREAGKVYFGILLLILAVMIVAAIAGVALEKNGATERSDSSSSPLRR
jgi:hypothetical protein